MMKQEKLWMIRGTVLIASAACIGYGLMREERLEVLKKAVNICLQCIGIG